MDAEHMETARDMYVNWLIYIAIFIAIIYAIQRIRTSKGSVKDLSAIEAENKTLKASLSSYESVHKAASQYFGEEISDNDTLVHFFKMYRGEISSFGNDLRKVQPELKTFYGTGDISPRVFFEKSAKVIRHIEKTEDNRLTAVDKLAAEQAQNGVLRSANELLERNLESTEAALENALGIIKGYREDILELLIDGPDVSKALARMRGRLDLLNEQEDHRRKQPQPKPQDNDNQGNGNQGRRRGSGKPTAGQPAA